MTDDFERAKNLFLKGNLFLEESKFVEAEDAYLESLKWVPNRASILINLSKVQIYLNKLDEAQINLDKASVSGKTPQIIINYGLIEVKRFNYSLAFKLFHEVLLQDPNNLEALFESIGIAHRDKDYETALHLLDRVLKIIPADAKFWNLRGNVFYEIKKFEEAEKCYDQSIALENSVAEYYYNSGNAKRNLDKYDEALQNFNEAIKRNNNFFDAFLNKANLLYHIKKYQDAIDTLNEVIEMKPDYFEAYVMKGVINNELANFEDAISNYQVALKIKPDQPGVLLNLGNTLNQFGQFDSARLNYEHAYRVNSGISLLLGSLLFSKMKVCHWSNLSNLKIELEKKILSGKDCALPFPLIAILNDEGLISRAAENSFKELIQISSNKHTYLNKEKKKIKIGYFSADFYNHATSYLMSGLFHLHDRNKFEIIGFSFGPSIEDEYRTQLKKSFDQFIDIQNLSDLETANLARKMNIDIAVDLKGHTQGSRTGIFAYRAAPIQVNYIGYPGSMGLGFIDYIIADKVIIDQKNQDFFTEKVVYLPNCYQVNDNNKKVSNSIITRQDFGLPPDKFIFCSFNNNYKITPEIFDVWMSILHKVKNSILWLLVDNSWAKDNLLNEAANRGISSERIYFAGKMDIADHLARHRLADLFLDTFPCCAHTTASDALWVGLPLLTLRGNTFASRVASSLLLELNLPELITNSLPEYENLAITLASQDGKLTKIKETLDQNKSNGALFNIDLYRQNLEKAYQMIYQRYMDGQSPDHIKI
jgi:tetratricopeptide (TPR) repeat protein